MKIYVDVNDYEVYTEKNIDEEISRKIKNDNYEGLLDYIADSFTESELFAILPSNIQAEFLENSKGWILDNEFYEREIDDPSPCDKCPHKK